MALENVTAPSLITAHWDFDGYCAIHTKASIRAGYELFGKQITYTKDSGGETIYVYGVNSSDGLSINGNVVTVSESALNPYSTVTISDGYELKLADDVTKSEITEAGWTIDVDNNVATHTGEAISEGYKVDNNQIIYVYASDGGIIKVSGVKSTDGLSIGGETVIVGAEALNESSVSIIEGFSYLELASNVALPTTVAGDWTIDDNDAVYKNDSIRAGYQYESYDNQIIYTPDRGGEELVTVSGVTSKDGLAIDTYNKIVTISDSALNQSDITISEGYTFALDYDVTVSTLTAAHWNFNGYEAVYKNDSISAGYELGDSRIHYVLDSGGEGLITVSGVISNYGLELNGTTVTVSSSALGTDKVTISDGYTLALNYDVPEPTLTEGRWRFENHKAVYKEDYISAGYSIVDNKEIVYSGAIGGNDLVSVSGVTSEVGLDIDVENKVVKVPASLLNQTSTVKISGDGYTLALGDDVSEKTSTINAGWFYEGTKAVYKNTEIFKGYKVENNEISYVPASGGGIVITVEGVKSAEGISLDGSIVTVSETALNKSPVSITNGYFLKLENADALAPKKRESTWTFNEENNVATYTDAGATEGYLLDDNNKIVYVPEDKGATVEITGVTSEKGLSINGKVVTVSESSLSQNSTVTITEGYELALGDVPVPTETPENWSPFDENGVTTYESSGMTAGYFVEDKQIRYADAIAPAITFSISGLTSTNGISINGNEVTIPKIALGTETVTISDGYTLALNDDSFSTTTKPNWIKDGTTFTYIGTGSTAGYELVESEIHYVVENVGETFTINGVISKDGISINGKEVTVSEESLGTEDVTISDGYELKLGSDVKPPKTSEAIWTKTDNGATCRVLSTKGYNS